MTDPWSISMAFNLALALAAPGPALAAPPTKTPGCRAEVISLWNELVASGCRLRDAPDRMPLVLRTLRNTPFAGRGYRFKSPELRDFFTAAKAGCEQPWYDPRHESVALVGKELECATKLRKEEDRLRKAVPMPKAMEVFLLTKLPQEFLAELRRHVREPNHGSRVFVRRLEDGGWQVSFYTEFKEDDHTIESSTIVTCDAKGHACRVDHAG